MARTIKYREMVEDLKGKIERGEYAVGERFPAIRRLAAEYRVSLTTATRCVNELKALKLVECGKGAGGSRALGPGTTRDRQARLAATDILFLLPKRSILRDMANPPADDFFIPELAAAAREYAARLGYKVHFQAMAHDDREEMAVRRLRRSGIFGALIDSTITDVGLTQIMKIPAPIVLLAREPVGADTSSVRYDYYHILSESLAYMHEKNCAKAFVYPAPRSLRSTSYSWTTRESFPFLLKTAARAAGFSPEQLGEIDEVFPKDPLANQPEQFALPRRKPKNWLPIGVFTFRDSFVKQLEAVVAKTDLVPDKDIFIVSAVACALNKTIAMPFATWRLSPRDMAETAINELLERAFVPGGVAGVIRLKAEFIHHPERRPIISRG